MAFDGIETVMENHRLSRKLSGHDMVPLSFSLALPNTPKVVALEKELRAQPYEHCVRHNPMGRFQFLLYLKYRATPAGQHHKLLLLQEVEKYKLLEADARKAEAQHIFDFYFMPKETVEESKKLFPTIPEEEETLKREIESQKDVSAAVSSTSAAAGKPSPASSVDSESKLVPVAASKAPTKVRVSIPKKMFDDLEKAIDSPVPGEDIFDAAVDLTNAELKEQLYPKFLKSDNFIKYVQYKEYATRTGIGMDDFVKFRTVGSGAFGAVCAVSKRDTSAVYAMKEMNKRQIKAEDSFNVAINERNVLASLESPFTTMLKYAFDTPESIFFVMDFASGGDLKWHIRNRGIKTPGHTSRHFSDVEAQFYAAEMLLALEHVHQMGIVYRDLKPHNLLLDSEGHIVLSDFGLAEFLENHKNNRLSSLGGTPGYWAPECLRRSPYGIEADIWSWGVCLYYFLVGMKPLCTCKQGQWCTFIHDDEKTQEDLAKQQGMEAYNGHIRYPEFMSGSAESLLRKVLEPDQSKRFTIPQIKEHRYFKNINWKLLASRTMAAPWIPEAAEVHAESLANVGDLDERKYRKVELSAEDQAMFENFEYCDEQIIQQEMADALMKQYKRFGPSPELAYKREQKQKELEETSGCCVVL